MSTTQHMTETNSPRGLSGIVVAVVLFVVFAVVAIAAFNMFGPKPEPHPRYNSAKLFEKAQRNPNSLTPDERRVYDHIMHRASAPPAAAFGSPMAQKK